MFSLWGVCWLANVLACCFPVKSQLRSLSAGPIVFAASSGSTVGALSELCLCTAESLCVREYVTLKICMHKGDYIYLSTLWAKPWPYAGRAIVILTFSAETGIYEKVSRQITYSDTKNSTLILTRMTFFSLLTLWHEEIWGYQVTFCHYFVS